MDRHRRRLFEYEVPGAPIVIAVLIERYPDVNGVLDVRVVFPLSPDDLVPDH